MPKRPDNQAWRYWRTVFGVVAAGVVLVIGGLTGHVTRADELELRGGQVCRADLRRRAGALNDRLLRILKDNDAKATFFQIGNKVAANPAGAKRIVDAGMEIGNHTWEHPNMTTIPPEDIAGQLSKANDAITAATGRTPSLYRPAGGLSDPVVRQAAGQVRPGRNPLGRHPFRLGQRLQHGGDALHADDPDQAGLGGVVP